MTFSILCFIIKDQQSNYSSNKNPIPPPKRNGAQSDHRFISFLQPRRMEKQSRWDDREKWWRCQGLIPFHPGDGVRGEIHPGERCGEGTPAGEARSVHAVDPSAERGAGGF